MCCKGAVLGMLAWSPVDKQQQQYRNDKGWIYSIQKYHNMLTVSQILPWVQYACGVAHIAMTG